MLGTNAQLTDQQTRIFDRFLLDGTDRAIDALEQVFGLDIDRSDSNIEVALLTDSIFLRHLGNGKLYAVNCHMRGDLEGRISLLLRSSDFSRLGRVMRPILNLLFLADPASDLESLESDKPAWLRSGTPSRQGDESFHRRMVDLLGELGNVLIGMYAKALFRAFHVTTNHSSPLPREDPGHAGVSGLIGDAGTECLHLVIENEFLIDGSTIGMWFVISPTQSSFRQLLH